MFTFRRPTRSLLVFLGIVVAVGAAFGHAIDAAGVAAFFFFISSITAKPAWKFWFDGPGKEGSGRGGRFTMSQRVGMTSPKELARHPRTLDTLKRPPSARRRDRPSA
jgi:hypothetical protein